MPCESRRYQNKRAGFLLIAAVLFCCIACAPKSRSLEEKDRLQSTPSHYTVYDGIRIHYVEEGKGLSAIVFIHGWCGDATIWRHQMNYFKKKYRVVAIDLPGHGLSGKPEIDYTFDLYAGAVKKVMEAVGIKRPFLVVHGTGLLVAKHFIQKYPGEVGRLCIIDGTYFRVPENPLERDRWQKQADAFLAGATGKNRSAFINSLFSKQTPPDLKNQIHTLMLGTPAYVADSTMKNLLKPQNWREHPSSLYVLAVYAALPDLPPDNDDYLHTLFPFMQYHQWKGVGHFIMLEAPDRFNRLLSGYLNRCPCNSIKLH